MRAMLAAAIAVALATLAGCTSYKPVSPAFQHALNEPYQLDAGDRVRVTVFEQASLTNTYAVNKGGYLSMPLVGEVEARGRTTHQLQSVLSTALADGFIRDPDVTVEVEQYRPFFIMGEVTLGGQYAYVPGMTAQNAIAIAGGYTTRADQRTVDVTRQVNGKILTGRVLASDQIIPGDTVYVRERLF